MASDVPRDIHVFAYVHDDVAADDQTLMRKHFDRWLSTMHTDVVPERRVHVHLRRNIPGVTNAPYGYDSAFYEWRRALSQHWPSGEDIPMTAPHRFNLLLVDGHVAPGKAGLADQGGHYAMASVNVTDFTPAHEIGHMLGAEHEMATRRETGFLTTCATIMWARANAYDECGGYSLHNVELIRSNQPFWDR